MVIYFLYQIHHTWIWLKTGLLVCLPVHFLGSKSNLLILPLLYCLHLHLQGNGKWVSILYINVYKFSLLSFTFYIVTATFQGLFWDFCLIPRPNTNFTLISKQSFLLGVINQGVEKGVLKIKYKLLHQLFCNSISIRSKLNHKHALKKPIAPSQFHKICQIKKNTVNQWVKNLGRYNCGLISLLKSCIANNISHLASTCFRVRFLKIGKIKYH